MWLCLAGGGIGWLLSHCVGRGIRRNVGLPSAELAPDKVPQPWGLATPLQGPFPVGPGEDDSAPREGREARPAQGAQGRAGSQAGSGTEQAGVFVLCPMSHAGTRGGGCHPRALQAQLPGRSRVRLSGMSRNTKRRQDRGRSQTPLTPWDRGQLEALGWVQRRAGLTKQQDTC